MRQIGSLSDERDARRFAAFLVTQGIDAHAEVDAGEWAIWVRDENRIDEARDTFALFCKDPTDNRYQGVEQQAEAIQREAIQRRVEAQKNVVEMRGRWKNTTTNRRAPLTATMIGLSVVVTLFSAFGESQQGVGGVINQKLMFCQPGPDGEIVGGPLGRISQGEVWRLVTPIFLHLSPIHLIFNMIMFFQFGGLVETLRGTARFAVMVLLMALLPNLAQAVFPVSLGGYPLFGGMSGVVYAFFGFMWMKSVFDPSSGIYLPPTFVFILMGWLFFCMTPIATQMVGNVANWAHAVGLLVGVVVGYWPSLIGKN